MTKRWPIVVALVLLAALPLAGSALRGFSEDFFSFPPLVTTQPVHAPFHMGIWLVFAALGLFTVLLLLRPRWFGFSPDNSSGPPRPYAPNESSPPNFSASSLPPSSLPPLPLHGWLGLLLLTVSWFLAWSRIDLPGPVEQHTFFPLWLGFILFLDGLVYRRSGTSLATTSRSRFILMFPLSALSWWYFEFLNRSVQNWWYPDRMDFGPVHYLVYSSLCFSTVLPAIFEIRDLLATFPTLRHRFSNGPRWHMPHAAPLVAFLGVVLLPLIPLFPDPLFFVTWVAPLALVAGALGLARVPSPFDPVRRGDWSPLLLLAYAALACGFFWELWNAFSSPRWAYAVPYVDRWPLFAMPVVGYTGYLPFGPICACFWLAWTALLPGAPPPRANSSRE
ncbi:MAG: hypothetical protein PHI93_05355 [Kiritimatiellae bacterium]|nr:hypothetical protein [Kiritimatiellia bacterium]